MKKFWIWSGRIAFWLVWPLLFVYLSRRERTRVIVVCNNEILVVKGWLGSGRWILPGGGLHAGEDALLGALREIKEETSLEFTPDQLQPLGVYRSKEFPFRYHLFVVVLSKKPKVKAQRLELIDIAWLSPGQLTVAKIAEPTTIEALQAWTPFQKLIQ